MALFILDWVRSFTNQQNIAPIERFSHEYRNSLSFITTRDWRKEFAPLSRLIKKTNPIVARLRTFSRALRELREFSLTFDWFYDTWFENCTNVLTERTQTLGRSIHGLHRGFRALYTVLYLPFCFSVDLFKWMRFLCLLMEDWVRAESFFLNT